MKFYELYIASLIKNLRANIELEYAKDASDNEEDISADYYDKRINKIADEKINKLLEDMGNSGRSPIGDTIIKISLKNALACFNQ